MRTRRSNRRPGISTVIGAVFFILVVFLVFSSTVLVFESFFNYSLTFKNVNQQDAANKATNLELTNFVFGGQSTPTQTATLATSQNNGATPRTLLPISNMNFSNGMQGWTFSRSYKLIRDNGLVQNSFLDILPGATVFTLAVANQDTNVQAPSGSYITGVTLQVDSQFSLSGYPLCNPTSPSSCDPQTGGCAAYGTWSVNTVGTNTIVWQLTSGSNTGIPYNNACMDFVWTAFTPAVAGTYYTVAEITWATTFRGLPLVDSGTSTVLTQVVTGGPGGTSSSNIVAQPAGAVPGGAVGGYDPISAGVGSESGPGSLYLDFQPTFTGVTLQGGEQLTAIMNFTSDFTLDSATASALSTTGTPDALSLGYSLDSLTSYPNPLIVMNTYLAQVNSAGTIIQFLTINQDVAPTAINDFGPTGWQEMSTSFLPTSLDPAWTWTPGLYELIVSVTASMPSIPGTPPSVYYPASMTMHFDDIGLSLQEVTSSYYADSSSLANPLQVSTSITPPQVQSITYSAQLSVNSGAVGQDVTGILFIGDVSRQTGNALWTEVGEVTFQSSATISGVVPATSSSLYVDPGVAPYPTCATGPQCILFRVYAISNSALLTSLTVNLNVVIQTWQQNAAVLTVKNNGTTPVHIVSAIVSGPGTVVDLDVASNSFNGKLGYWLDAGQTQYIGIPSSFVWSAGQTYVATIVTDKGVQESISLVSP